MITDEIINKAFKAYIESDAWSRIERMRAALKAVEPMLIEQGRRIEIQALAEKIRGDANSQPPRAQELDPK